MTEPDDSTHDIAERIAASVRAQRDENSSSRRGFLGKSALAGGTLLALGGTGFALAGGDDDDGNGKGSGNGGSGNETDGDTQMEANFDDVEGTDVDVLNYALSLEHLENTFYREALDMFSEEDFVNAETIPEAVDAKFRRDLFEHVKVVGEHESAHVEVISQAVTLLGGEPVQECTYNFGMGNVDDFLALAQVFENTGVAAYAGAAPFIESPDLQSAALSIHSVEARHAAMFNVANGKSPFPHAFDPAKSQQEVLNAVSDFIESCPEKSG